ncbi:MAG: HAMP domain-containing protein [Gammaproteobacteria bacterium]|nr:HAMP domain-containing protein [Gammaproteobacteria bacterium]
MLLFLCLSALLALLLSRQIIGPIKVLSAAAGRISQGDLNTEIEATGPNELYELGHTLQSMTRRLKEIIAILERSEFPERRACRTLAAPCRYQRE